MRDSKPDRLLRTAPMRLLREGARHRLQRAMAALCSVAALGLPMATSAEVKEVQIARGFAIPHLPIMIMEHDKLLEKHALRHPGERRVRRSDDAAAAQHP